MKDNLRPSRPPVRFVYAVAALSFLGFTDIGGARAANPLDLYVGAQYGGAHIRTQLTARAGSAAFPLGNDDLTHSAYQVEIGVRPISFFGVEIAYMDFGQQSLRAPRAVPSVLFTGGEVSQKGEAAFAVLYIPLPIVELYLKAGVARITSNSSVSYYTQIPPGPGCEIIELSCAPQSFADDVTDIKLAEGAGLQWRLGRVALRAEYERFTAAASHPTLASIGAAWTIPYSGCP